MNIKERIKTTAEALFYAAVIGLVFFAFVAISVASGAQA